MALVDKVSQFAADADLLHKVVHGTETQTVTTESGERPTLARLITLKNDQIDAAAAAQFQQIRDDADDLIAQGAASVAAAVAAQEAASAHRDTAIANANAAVAAQEAAAISEAHAADSAASAATSATAADTANTATQAALAQAQTSIAASLTAAATSAQTATDKAAAAAVSEAAAALMVKSTVAASKAWDESFYTRALYFAPPPRQDNAVRDWSPNVCDAQVFGIMSPAETYDTEAGWLSTGMSTNKALFIHNAFLSWDLAADESLMVFHKFKVTSLANIVELFGNGTGTGGNRGCYARVNTNGTVTFGVATGAGSNGSSITVGTAVVGQEHTLVVHVNGKTKTWEAWFDGAQNAASYGVVIPSHATGGYSTNNSNHFGIGVCPGTSLTPTTCQPLRTRAVRIAKLPAGLEFRSPQRLAYRFQRSHYEVFSDVDYIGGA